ncbi:MAG: hypothetical protein V4628_09005, partial [Pseudomonadota bacterium]
ENRAENRKGVAQEPLNSQLNTRVKNKIPNQIKEHERYVLKPENKAKAYPLLRPDPLEILGVVTGSFRSYRR